MPRRGDYRLFEEYAVMPYVKHQKIMGRNKQLTFFTREI